jgi:hypothetical protein
MAKQENYSSFRLTYILIEIPTPEQVQMRFPISNRVGNYSKLIMEKCFVFPVMRHHPPSRFAETYFGLPIPP